MAEQTMEEEARSCPKCKQFGQLATTQRGPRGSTVRTYTCTNEACTWYGTGWVVQINADGTIPLRSPKGQKEFPEQPKHVMDWAEANLERLKQADSGQ